MSIELERDDVFSFYRPRMGVPEVKRLEDAQRFFVILHPGRGERLRRIVAGSKRLPDPERHERACSNFRSSVATRNESSESGLRGATSWSGSEPTSWATEPLRGGALE